MTKKTIPEVSPLLDASGNPSLVAAGGLIESAWGNSVAVRVVNRYPTETAMRAASASLGQLAVTTDQNIVWIRTATTWLPTGVGNNISFRLVGGGAGQNVPVDTFTTATFTGEDSDLSGVVTAGVFTCPPAWPGRWTFEWSVEWVAGAAGLRVAFLLVGSGRFGTDTRESGTGNPSAMTGAASVVMTGGQQAMIQMYRTLGGGSQVVNNTVNSYFQGYYVGPA